ncbi:MAG: dTDP-glucose 4,6-dehydratase [Acidiferrobacterales bacterium]|nr:dTDP-glucose 4,6-dehydratase [Acidiferrobacterales bacterium]
MMDKRLLITGGAGFIGSAVVRQAIASDYFVINLDALTYAGSLNNVEEVADSSSYVFEHANICDRGTLERIFSAHKPDAVIHLAAESHVDRSISGSSAFIETNINGTYQLLDVALEFWKSVDCPESFRFHHVSTDEVYGSLDTDGRFHENDPYSPNSPYSASKAASDHLVRAWHHTYGLPVVITNCSNNYGPCQHPEKFIPTIIWNSVSGTPIPVYGRGRNVREWLFVEDHADALLTVMERGAIGRTYNIGSDNEFSNIELVEIVCSMLDKKVPNGKPHFKLVEFVEDRPGHDFRYSIDSTRIKHELNWEATTPFEVGIEKTLDWYLSRFGAILGS